MSRNRVLGKGLSALIPSMDLNGVPGAEGTENQVVKNIALDEIGFNPDQPRKLFDENALGELAASIVSVGVLQPVLLKPLVQDDNIAPHPLSASGVEGLRYGVVAGERRVRAARLAGLSQIPALICSYEGVESLRVALLENIQREDLGPVEEAEAYRHLMNTSGSTQEKLADMLGKSRSTLANSMRLLALEKEILDLLQERKLSRGHAKALLGAPPGPARIALARACVSRGMSVRECEARVKAPLGHSRKARKPGKKASNQDPAVKAFQERAERVYGSPVTIEREAGTGKGQIKVRFYSDSDLVRLLRIMGVDTELS